MSERWIENLVRMAGEAERLDQRAATFQRAGRASVWPRWTGTVMGLAAAILALIVILPMSIRPKNRGDAVPPASGVNICHLANETRVERVSVEPVSRERPNPAWLVALVRSWNVDCQCLLWDVHRFADGASLADVRPGESLSLDLNVARSPAVEQVLVLAVAEDRGRLVGATAADAVELLNCLNSRDIAATGEHDTAGYASAVESCLPQGVTVFSSPLLQTEN